MRISSFLASLLLVLATTATSFADDHACTTQEMLYRGKLALEPELILAPENIHYQILGEENQDTIVLIHGLGGSLHTWWEVAKDLASQNYKVVIYDQRGHGDTPAKGENYSSSMMASDLKVLLDKLGIKKADVLGHSMGARTAMRFANLFPDRVRSVILEDMHMMGRRTLLSDNLEVSRKLAKLRSMSFNTWEDAADAASNILGVDPEGEGLYHLGLDQNRDTHMFQFFNAKPQVPLYSSQGLQEDLTAPLADVKVPVLFLAAEKEPVLFGKGVDHIRATNPAAHIEVIPGTDHGMHDSNFGDYMRRVKSFLKSGK